MKMIRAVLVDDERAGRSRLRRLLEKDAAVKIVAECDDGSAALAAVKEHRPDLLLLDINLPGLDGFAVLEALGPERQPPAVVFVTAYDEHAVRAFETCALDYLLKPVSPERLEKALLRVRERLSLPKGTPGAPRGVAPAQRFTARSGSRISFIAPGEIDWAEAAGNYVILHVEERNHMVRETMAGLEGKLAAEGFLRVSRSAIVNLKRIKELQSSPSGENRAVLGDGLSIPVTRPLHEVASLLARITA